ncbi:MAG: ABC transporter permease [Oscillospiraceae bacterium]|nr:ABC transporter permease [Oscillospiraceae bacterium]
MKIFDILATSFGNLFKRKTRTILTLLGVVLGSASVAMTFAIGDAVKRNNELILESTGLLRYIEVYSSYYSDNSSSSSNSSTSTVYLDDNLINKAKKIDNVKCVYYTLRPSNIVLVAGKNDKYKANMSNILGIDFEEAHKFGLTLLDNSAPDFSNYKFNPSGNNIKAIGGQYFEYLFENTAASQNSGRGDRRGGGGRGPGGPGGRKNNSSNRYMNSPVMQYMFSRWGSASMQEDVIPPFVNADEDNVFLAIQYPNTNSSSSLSEYDMNFDENNILLENNNNNLYKYKKYKLNLAGRYNWDAVKDNDVLANTAGNCILVDINTAKTLIREAKKLNKETSTDDSDIPEFIYESVIIEANNIDHVLDITKELKKMGYEVYNLMSTIENEQLRARSNQFILGLLGCLALLVSTISISNTMITSVYERTKEIGIMKVLGCKIGNIQIMFLIESGIIGLFGGLIGVSSSYLLSNFMNKLVAGEVENMGVFANIISNYIEGMKTDMSFLSSGDIAMKVAVVDPKLCLLVILGTTLLGLIAGYFPSLIASKIEALRAIKSSK